MSRLLSYTLPFALLASLAAAAEAVQLKSPDGNLAVAVDIKDVGAAKACPVYSVTYKGRTIVAESRLGLELKQGALNAGLRIVGQSSRQHDMTWRPVCAERETIRDHFNELVLDLQRVASPPIALRLTFRAYDEGIAFCYTLPAQDALKEFTIAAENTSFGFTADYTTWAVYAAQGNYDGGEVTLSKVKPGVERPLTVRIADDLYVSITEARLVDYARMKLRPAKQGAGSREQGASMLSSPLPAPRSRLPAYTLEAFLDAERQHYGQVTGVAPFTSPWRVVTVADSPGRLLEQNYLVLNLNDPCALRDTSWIKPGKVIREVTLTTAGGKASVDFCAAGNAVCRVRRRLVRQGVRFPIGRTRSKHRAETESRPAGRD